ncbi:hypothetical protein D9613_012923 [Agrocybe pediades]|uniref:Uncharacterized protein n=1 Tax=Agrocybe pediades TaxID=84607 RepID=A0A8H4QEW8_9AGAR|nr:hypothetical protein D9613_012923 [Agrocybe pediades]
MSITPDLQPGYVFVDDSDYRLEYNSPQVDDWYSATTQTTSFPAGTRPPLFNTLHVQTVENTEGTISYSFNGTFVSAHFMTVDVLANAFGKSGPTTNCTLDGQLLQHTFNTYPAGPDSEGGFIVFATGTSGLGFDGLFYNPFNFKGVQENIFDSDLVYPIQRNLTMSGDTFDFHFTGSRAALYTVYGVGGIDQPVNLSYSVDGGPSIDFSLRPIADSTTTADYLLIQTDIHTKGEPHDLHLELNTGNVSMPVLVPLQYAIVQNAESTIHLDLDVVPPTSAVTSAATLGSTTTTGSLAKNHKVGRNSIIYISVSLSATLILIVLGTLLILRRRWMSRTRSNEDRAPNYSGMIAPFLVERPSIVRLAFNAVDSKNSRRMRVVANGERRAGKGARGVDRPPVQTTGLVSSHVRAHPAPTPPPQPPAHSPQMEETTQPTAPAHAIAAPHPTYRIHEDAGSVSTTTPVPEEEVIDLPPNYSSILGRFRRASRTE